MKYYVEILDKNPTNFQKIREELGLSYFDVITELGEDCTNDYFLAQYYNKLLKSRNSKRLFSTGKESKNRIF